MYFDDNFKDFKCSNCTDTLKMSRACGLPEYKGSKLEPVFKINFGKKSINECPNSYCSWEYVEDAITSWKFYNDGYLPDTYNNVTKEHLSIVDQSDFFLTTARLVDSVKNRAEAKAYEEIQKKNKI